VTAALAQTPAGWTPVTAFKVKRLDPVRPSPDGQWVACVVGRR
jgi:hypothetical protein